MSRLHEPHPYPGRLIVVEGIDGSGKSTQAELLQQWLASEGLPVFWTEWNSSALVKSTTKKAKKRNSLTPTTFSLLHATDFADRQTYNIIPPLKSGMLVIADRYVYTAFARDCVRGVHRDWVRQVYSYAIHPDISFYFRVPLDVSLSRLLSVRQKLKFYEAGMDTGMSNDPVECFRMFQGAVLGEYDRISDEFGMEVVDASAAIQKQQKLVRQIVQDQIGDYINNPPVKAEPMPGVLC